MPQDGSATGSLPRPFRRLVWAWSSSLTGDGLRVVAVPLAAVAIDPSPGAVALVAAASSLPWLLVAVPAGALVDRWNPIRVMAAAHVVRAALAVVLAVLLFLDHASIPALCVFAFAMTAAETFTDGAAQSLMVRLVPGRALERANSRFVTTETLALDLAGPVLAGVLVAVAPGLALAVCGGCFLLAAVFVGLVRPGTEAMAPVAPGTPQAGLSTWGRIRQGMSVLWRDRVLRVLVVTVAVLALANGTTDAVLVLYGTQTLGFSELFYPSLLVAYSIGTLTAAQLVPRVVERYRGGPVMLLALIAMGVVFVLLGLFPGMAQALLLYAALGVAQGSWNVLSATRRQRRTPLDLIARVSSAFRVLAWGALPAGAALGGFVAHEVSVPAVFVVAGVIVLLLGAVVGRSFLEVERARLSTPPG
ncbi:MFS transporter [Nakamurella flavida]|uniref:MFS transporter n=1 Tax=Nakamurella flavida TaxID=363630 RepID=UPI0019632932